MCHPNNMRYGNMSLCRLQVRCFLYSFLILDHPTLCCLDLRIPTYVN